MQYGDRLMRILAEEGLARVPDVNDISVETPCGTFTGLSSTDPRRLCAVSIIRSGDTLLEAVRALCSGIAVGKILIQRDETHPEKLPKLYYSKLPADISSRNVILVDPMLATGGSAKCAVSVLKQAGVPAKNILFLNVVSCPEGIRSLLKEHPEIRIVTCSVDPNLNDNKYIAPGLGDFGDRYYSTEAVAKE